jgi:hypothetical protein
MLQTLYSRVASMAAASSLNLDSSKTTAAVPVTHGRTRSKLAGLAGRRFDAHHEIEPFPSIRVRPIKREIDAGAGGRVLGRSTTWTPSVVSRVAGSCTRRDARSHLADDPL